MLAGILICGGATSLAQTETLDKLIPQEGRKTLEIKSAVAIDADDKNSHH
jgi:hypothetical protein